MTERLQSKKIIVGESFQGERIDSYLAHELQTISRSQLQKLIADGQVMLNGGIAVKKDIVSGNDCIEISFSGVREQNIIPVSQDIPLEILYEDDHLIVINKQPGIAVHPGSGIRDGTLVNALMHHCAKLSDGSAIERPGIVHRLDKDTTGVIVVAKTNRVHDALSFAFMNRTVKKQYVGFCVGKASEGRGMIDIPLDRNKREPIKRAPSVHGKPSKTEYVVASQRAGIVAMRFILHTGRTHQIRVHCSSMGFPIVADVMYGGGKDRILRIDPLDRPFAYSIFKCFNRQALHAYFLSFKHPVTAEQLTIHAPLPDDFNAAALLFGNRDLFTLESKENAVPEPEVTFDTEESSSIYEC